MNPEYRRLAHRREVITALRRHLEDTYLDGASDKKDLHSDVLPFNDRQVPNEVVIEVIQQLQGTEAGITDELSKFDFRKREPKPLLPAGGPAAAPDKGGKPRAKAGDAG